MRCLQGGTYPGVVDPGSESRCSPFGKAPKLSTSASISAAADIPGFSRATGILPLSVVFQWQFAGTKMRQIKVVALEFPEQSKPGIQTA